MADLEKRHFSVLHIRKNTVVYRADYRTRPMTLAQHKKGMKAMLKKCRDESTKTTLKVLELP